MTDRAPVTGLPKYVAISEMLIREIAAGHLADGARLPPERDMAEDLAISVGTLRKALAELEGKGLLDRVQGSGNYVRHRADVDSVYAFSGWSYCAAAGCPRHRCWTWHGLPSPLTRRPSVMRRKGTASDGCGPWARR